jgi:DNA-binding NarL/FixJ family response regulator
MTETPVAPQDTTSRILIVDDHPLIRRALREMIDASEGLTTCGEASSEPEALDLVSRLKPDLAIVDLSLQSGTGLDLIKNIRAIDERVRMLVLSMHEEAYFAPRALRAGALGYVHKGEPQERLLKAIREVLQGRVHLSGNSAQPMLRRMVGGEVTIDADLSDREAEVLELIGGGLATRKIAEHLHLSVKTIETYREKLKTKLGLADAAELACYAAIWTQEQTR